MLNSLKIFKGIVIFMAMLFLSVACENKVEEVRILTKSERIPSEVQHDVFLVYTDSTLKKMEMEAPLAENYPNLEEPQREFPKGIKVRFYNELGEQSSSLTAEYALQLVNKNLWEARGNVIVINTKGEQLNTEKLFWDNRKEIIYSDEFVKITTPEQVIMGEGFTADQNFDEYEINRPTGTINIDDNA
jgi:LPS export ABC transporter protein LptC